MKTAIIVSLLCLASMSGRAQHVTQFPYSTKDNPPLVNNGAAIPVTPAFDVPYKVVSDTPCYMYKKNGLVVVNCPGVWFEPEGVNRTVRASRSNENINVQTTNTYMGNYPVTEEKIPANAVPVYPSGSYIPLKEGAPCYQYKTKKGLEVMECHGLWFPPENKNQD